ncbi:metalloregulator ArsR/SmtB family transcription factor [Sphaerisporangium sp. TRM90804]|uniref:ArsR/SmtB family transcription factor n=1 Tax=Sphaerisporangium sp. TRM90804 TaxID=3031113 RepID=UPI0024473AAB|nr:metalloregulator ArsR/SmtB family transcription factor [Sphaerisporangium sp. TRM90804]MDH2430609.1 metalloregulator ArsR/SmtB family transcription factor [Sphaerisporangium sp. TRM90804]
MTVRGQQVPHPARHPPGDAPARLPVPVAMPVPVPGLIVVLAGILTGRPLLAVPVADVVPVGVGVGDRLVPVAVPVLVIVGLFPGRRLAVVPVFGAPALAGGRIAVPLLGHGSLTCGRQPYQGAYVDMYARDNKSGATPSQVQPTAAQIGAAAEAFRMLGDATRLRLMWRLSSGEHDVGSLAGALDVARPSVSQHLAKLRLAGLVDTRREGRRMLYRARGPHIGRLLAEALFPQAPPAPAGPHGGRPQPSP